MTKIYITKLAMKAVYCQFCDTPLLKINLTKYSMKAKTMKIFDKSKPETDFFGVKIQLSPRRAVYVANQKQLYCYPTEHEAHIKANEVNLYIADNPDLEIKLHSDKTIKVVIL